jgi:hypothetical protein
MFPETGLYRHFSCFGMWKLCAKPVWSFSATLYVVRRKICSFDESSGTNNCVSWLKMVDVSGNTSAPIIRIWYDIWLSNNMRSRGTCRVSIKLKIKMGFNHVRRRVWKSQGTDSVQCSNSEVKNKKQKLLFLNWSLLDYWYGAYSLKWNVELYNYNASHNTRQKKLTGILKQCKFKVKFH